MIAHAVVTALASHQFGPSLILRPGVICELCLLLVLAPATRVFSGFFGLYPFTKTSTSKFQFGPESEGHRFVSRQTVARNPR